MGVKSHKVLPASAVLFAILSAAAGSGVLRPIDSGIVRRVQARPSGVADAVGGALSSPGRALVSVPALSALALWLHARGRGGLGRRLLVCLFATTLVELLLKFALPQPPIPEEIERVPDSSLFDLDTPYPYPSGHMLRSVVLLGAVYALWPNRAVRAAVALFLPGSAAARVYLGAHWPSDVLGGALLGAAGLAWAFDGEKVLSPRARR